MAFLKYRNMALNWNKWPKMTFTWPLRSKMISDHQNIYLIGFLGLKHPSKVIQIVILALFVFLAIFNTCNIFSTLGPKSHPNLAVRPIAIVFVSYNLTKKHGLHKSLLGESYAPWLIYVHSRCVARRLPYSSLIKQAGFSS